MTSIKINIFIFIEHKGIYPLQNDSNLLIKYLSFCKKNFSEICGICESLKSDNV